MVIRPIYPDQLTENLASLREMSPENDLIVMSERGWSLSDRPHHPKKLVFLIAAQRHFALSLEEQGYKVFLHPWDAQEPCEDLSSFMSQVISSCGLLIEGIVVTNPSSAECQKNVAQWSTEFNLPVTIKNDDRFYCSIDDFYSWALGRKTLRMEYFYRMLRVRENILIVQGQPEGGAWNYDSENRQPAKNCPPSNQTYREEADQITQDVITLLKQTISSENFGVIEPFHYAVTRQGALQALELFIDTRLSFFGDFQDVMRDDDPWLYHSHMSLYLNAGLLVAKECVEAALEAYRRGKAPLNAVEGFVRQILGWREFVRGLYAHYQALEQPMNALGADRALPSLYWGGETKMRCLQQCVSDTYQKAYAHHIQRLMVLGNFALLAGIDPAEVDLWYLLVYADAYEWVEQPNVLGMILWADGGLLASKPYAASGAYINKMSNYCQKCFYSVQDKDGDKACPFNYLYWDFLRRHEKRFRSNPRLAMIYKTFDRLGLEKIEKYQKKAETFLEDLQSGKKV